MKKTVCNIVFIIAMLSMVSCNDFLDEKPDKNSSLVPTTTEHLEYKLNYIWDFYQEDNRTLMCSSDDYGLVKELFDAKSSSYFIDEVQFAAWDVDNIPLSTRERYWRTEYSKIFSANMVLENLSKVSGTPEKKEELRCEAHFIRAYSLWNLAQSYCLPYTESNKGELGLVLKKSTSFEEPTNRATLEETYQLIEADLQEALKLEVNLEKVNNKFKIWRASKAAVNAFAARYYLNRNNYEKAAAYADEAIKKHGVMVDYNTEMRYSSIPSSIVVNGKTEQVLYPYTHDNQSDFTDMLEWKELYYFRLLYLGSWWFIPSKELLNLYDKTYDLRFKYHMVDNYSYTRGVTNPAYEYPGYVFFFKDRIISGPTVAEMHLIKAECLARSGKVNEAMTEVNILRDKRMDKNAPDAVKYLTATEKYDAIKKISEERRREMPFMQRWYDIRRFNSNDDPSDDIGDITRSFYGYTNSRVESSLGIKEYVLPKNSRRYACPIPYTEIISSEGVIKQNTY